MGIDSYVRVVGVHFKDANEANSQNDGIHQQNNTTRVFFWLWVEIEMRARQMPH